MTPPAWLLRVESFSDTVLGVLGRRWIAACFAIVALLALLPQPPVPDPDVFARLAVGRLIVEGGAVTDQDPFAYTPRLERWIDHEWLSGLLFYEAWSVGGERALFMLQVLAIALTVLLLMLAQRAVSAEREWGSLVLILGAIPCMYLWATTVRSQAFTYLFLALLFLALARYYFDDRRLLLLLFPLVMAVWANAHGGFVTGLGLLGIASVLLLLRGRVLPFVVLLLCIVATGVNPFGVSAYWRYILDAVSMPRPDIDEWQALNPLSADGIIPLIGCVAVFCGACVKVYQRKFIFFDVIAAAFIAVSAYAGFRHYRLIAIAMMSIAALGAPFIAAIAHAVPGKGRATLRVSLWGALAALILIVPRVVGLCAGLKAFALDYRGYPVAALEYLVEHEPGGNVLISFNAGSYALWRLYPRFKVAVDGRYEELYPESTVYAVARALNPRVRGHAEALREVWPEYIVIENALAQMYAPQFGVVYRDGEFSVLKRLCRREAPPEKLKDSFQ